MPSVVGRNHFCEESMNQIKPWTHLSTLCLKALYATAPKSVASGLYDRLWNRWQANIEHVQLGRVSTEELTDYTPIRFQVSDGGPWIVWLKTGRLRLVEPFFEQSVFRTWCGKVSPKLVSTDAHKLPMLSQAQEGLLPRGIILHLSRCGS